MQLLNQFAFEVATRHLRCQGKRTLTRYQDFTAKSKINNFQNFHLNCFGNFRFASVEIFHSLEFGQPTRRSVHRKVTHYVGSYVYSSIWVANVAHLVNWQNNSSVIVHRRVVISSVSMNPKSAAFRTREARDVLWVSLPQAICLLYHGIIEHED